MQLLAHRGPNWGRHATAVRTQDGSLAVGIGRTIVLYSKDGTFEGELRTIGRGLITSLAFCDGTNKHSNLLVSSTTERNIRIIDVEARRIVQSFPEQSLPKTHRIIYARMLPQSNIVIVLLEAVSQAKQSTDALAVCFNGSTAKLVDRHQIHGLHTITKVTQRHQLTFVSGANKGRTCGLTFVLQIDPSVQDKNKLTIKSSKLLQSIGVVSDFSLRPIFKSKSTVKSNGGAEDQSFRQSTDLKIAVLHEYETMPKLYYAASELSEWKQINDANGNAKIVSGKPYHGKQLSVCCEWISEELIATSDVRGALYMWYVHTSLESDEVETSLLCIKPQAHSRQVLNIHTVPNSDICLSASTDKTIAMWKLMGMKRDTPALALCWRTVRTNGAVTEVNGSEDGIVYGCDQGTVTHIGEGMGIWDTNIAPSNPSNSGSKRPRTRYVDGLSHVHTKQALFKSSDGGAGIIKWNKENQVKVSPCKWSKKRGNNMQTVISIHGKMALVRSTNKDGIDTLEMWRMGNENETMEKVGELNASRTCQYSSSCALDVALRLGLVVGTREGRILVWSHDQEWHEIKDFSHFGKSIDKVCVSDDTSDGGVIAAWDSDGHLLVHWFDVNTFQIRACAVTQLDKSSKITRMAWNRTWQSEPPVSNATSGSERSKYLATIHANNQVVVWSITLSTRDEGGQIALHQQGAIKEHFGAVKAVAWKDSTHLVTGGQDGSLRQTDVTRLPQNSNVVRELWNQTTLGGGHKRVTSGTSRYNQVGKQGHEIN